MKSFSFLFHKTESEGTVHSFHICKKKEMASVLYEQNICHFSLSYGDLLFFYESSSLPV